VLIIIIIVCYTDIAVNISELLAISRVESIEQ
jgi:hypothetical protein